jgi:C1A family cysteine protease
MRQYPLKASPISRFEMRWRDAFPTAKPAGYADLSAWLPPVRDQGQEGSCSAFSGANVREMMARKHDGDSTTLSPAFLYEVERYIEGDLQDDNGATLRNTQRALRLVGVCPEGDDPYTPADFTVSISPKMVQDAAAYKVSLGYSLRSLAEVLSALSAGYPVQLGIVVYESFESDEVARTGIVPMPQPGERVMGGHAVAGYGFELTSEGVGCRNSWGDWGVAGNFTLPFDYFRSPDTFMDARCYAV